MLAILKSAPRAPVLLGLGGVLPFAASALMLGLTAGAADQSQRALAEVSLLSLLLYGAIILSFLGGTRWGREVGDASRPTPHALELTGAILPSVVAWVALLVALPPVGAVPVGLAMTIGAFVAMLVWDRAGVASGLWPAWYGPLRMILTLGAVGALGFAFAVVL